MAESNAVPEVDAMVSSPEAYTRLLPEIMAVPEQTLHLNLDIMKVVTSTMGCLPKIVAMKPEIAKKLPTFDLTLIEKLDDYAAALQHAFVLYTRATKAVEPTPQIIAQLTEFRDTFHADALALAKRGLLQGEAFKDVKKANGYRPLIVDVQVLASLLKDNWSKIGTKTAVQLEELDRAIALADRLVHAIGLKEQSSANVAEATLILKKAFTLFAGVHEDIRWAIRYLRYRFGDADEIMPSIYATRQATSRPRAEGEIDSSTDLPAEPAAVAPVATVPAVAPPPVPQGLPGASPYVRS